MNNEELLEALRARKKTLEPGDATIFDYEYVINLLANLDNLGYGHALLDRKNYQVDTVKSGHELLGLPYEPNKT